MSFADASASGDEADAAGRRRGGLRGVALAYLGLLVGIAAVAVWLASQDGKAEPEARLARVEVAIERVPAEGTAPSERVPAPQPEPPPRIDLPAPAPPPPVVMPAPTPAPVPPPAAPSSDGKVTLASAPAPGLVEDTPAGPLPRVARDGRQAWQVYARPFDLTDKRPRISIVISELGLSSAATEAAIERLPGAVTLAFVPFAERLSSWVDQARAGGHEVLLTVPMEPLTYPRDDPGPQALLTSLSDRENVQRLEWVMSRVAGYVGVISFMGSRFTSNPVTLRPVLAALKSRGLLYVDNQPGVNSFAPGVARDLTLPHVVVDRVIDDFATRAAIDDQLAALEAVARDKGTALGVGSPYPVTLDRIAQWAPTLATRGIVLAPVSALARRP